MKTLNRYLSAIAVLLPKDKRAAAEAEIGDTLLLQIEEQQTELGRVLTKVEIETLLRAYGHPLSVAARYRSQEHFIGPTILPIYWFALQVGLGATLIAHAILACLAIVSGENAFAAIATTVQALVASAVLMFGSMTLIAIFLERFGIVNRLENNKKVWSLFEQANRFRKRIEAVAQRSAHASNASLLKVRKLIIFDFICIGVLVIFLSGALTGDYLLPTVALIRLGWAAMLLVVAQTAVHVVAITKPARMQSYVWANAAMLVGRLGLLVALLNRGPLFEIGNSAALRLPTAISLSPNQGLSLVVGIGLLSAIVITGIKLIATVIRSMRAGRDIGAQHTGTQNTGNQNTGNQCRMLLCTLSLAIVTLALSAALTPAQAREAKPQNSQISKEQSLQVALAIDEGMFVTINGVEQWITIRGRDLKNPVLLFLHGGPGIAMSGSAPAFAEVEKQYTVVQWDQPSSGSTAVKNMNVDQGPLTIERFTRDGIAVTEYVLRHLGKKKLVLIGNSWGTVLGLEMVKKRSDLFSAYVGTSQAVSGPKGSLIGYELGLRAAQARNDKVAVAALERVGPPPYKTFEDFLVRQQYTNPPGLPASAAEQAADVALAKVMSVPPPLDAHYIAYRTLPTGFNGMQVFMDTQRAMFEEVFGRWEARDLGITFTIPIFIFQGENDLNTPASLAKEYFDAIKAPKKAFAIIPGAGHNTLAFGPEILYLLNTHVRPVVVK